MVRQHTIFKKISEWGIAFLFVLPYLERGFISEFLSFKTSTLVWRGVLTLEIVVFVFLAVKRLFLGVKIRKINYGITLFFLVIFVNSLIYSAISNEYFRGLNVCLMILLPLVNAFFVISIIDKEHIGISSVVKKSIYLYSAFTIFTIFYNVAFLGMSLSFFETQRMSAPAGGVVTLGYTMSLVFTLMIACRRCFKTVELIVLGIVLLYGVFLTKDRGSIPIIIIDFVYLFMVQRNKNMRIVLFIPFTIILLLSAFIIVPFFLKRNVSLLSFLKDDRFTSAYNSIEALIKNPDKILFGYGLNGFFPYQKWLATTMPEDRWTANFNTFLLDDKRILVQPHSTWLYLLMETGLAGVFCFVFMFACILKKWIRKSGVLLVVLNICVLSLLESTLILEPGIAVLWWLILLYTIYYSKRLESKPIRCASTLLNNQRKTEKLLTA